MKKLFGLSFAIAVSTFFAINTCFGMEQATKIMEQKIKILEAAKNIAKLAKKIAPKNDNNYDVRTICGIEIFEKNITVFMSNLDQIDLHFKHRQIAALFLNFLCKYLAKQGMIIEQEVLQKSEDVSVYEPITIPMKRIFINIKDLAEQFQKSIHGTSNRVYTVIITTHRD